MREFREKKIVTVERKCIFAKIQTIHFHGLSNKIATIIRLGFANYQVLACRNRLAGYNIHIIFSHVTAR
jgi:hypothetical protein